MFGPLVKKALIYMKQTLREVQEKIGKSLIIIYALNTILFIFFIFMHFIFYFFCIITFFKIYFY